MTRKDFALIAYSLRSSGAPEYVCRNLCTDLANEHPRFDIDRFLTACGISDI